MKKTDGLQLRAVDMLVGLASVVVPLAMLVITYALRENGISFIVGAVNGLILMVAVWLFAVSLNLWRTIPLPEDVTGYNPKSMKAIQPMVETLHDMGFDFLGELRLNVPLMPRQSEWVFISGDQPVIASVMRRGAKTFFVQFATVFDNNAVIHTEYPDSDNTDLPTFRSTGIRTSPEAAYGYHLREMTVFADEHGEIREFHSLDDWRDWYRTFLHLYGSYKLSRSFQRESRLFIGASMAVTGLIFGLIMSTSGSTVAGILLILMFLAGVYISRGAMTKGRDIQKHKPEESETTDDTYLSDIQAEYDVPRKQQSRK